MPLTLPIAAGGSRMHPSSSAIVSEGRMWGAYIVLSHSVLNVSMARAISWYKVKLKPKG
jgi:hypothetical protein